MILHNHIAFKMGKHEEEVAKHIPEGGNWKDIPLSIEDKRLNGIRATGGRTTYYGRLRWDAPSYTIATYYNRVGNGCNLHPSQARVMSTREAARFQSFPDDFIFVGSKASQYKQIGNAVPPLLGRFVSTLIKPHLDSFNFVDLFAGCGGLSEGFLMNGFNLLAANEFDKNIIQTNILNHSKHVSKDKFILGDVTKEETKQNIYDACGDKQVDVILGGPPCQGFSYAGWRDPNDNRNQLFREFVSIVRTLKPKFFVMENVLGILTMRNGEAIKDIIHAFSDEGYHVGTPLKLNSMWFGVPQKRKRVFIIGSLDPNIEFQQPTPLFDENDIFLPKPITVRDAIGSLPEIGDGGGEIEMDWELTNPTPYDLLMQREIDFDEFYQMMKDNIL
ncbi:MAG: DNA (cytosine-5-)-methyltransferase [Prevotella sp.]|nr:DNA (cytosine-5-)-methyltransferase [Prevotella sp.]